MDVICNMYYFSTCINPNSSVFSSLFTITSSLRFSSLIFQRTIETIKRSVNNLDCFVEGIERVSAFTANSSTLPNILFTSESLKGTGSRLLFHLKIDNTCYSFNIWVSPIRFASIMTYQENILYL
jgi:hypothetical protein